MDQNQLIDHITQEVMRRIQENDGVTESKKNSQDVISHTEMARYIDHTLLKPESTSEQHDRIVAECIQYGFKSICVNSGWVGYVAGQLRASDVRVCSVVGFPLGAMKSRSKAFETREAVADGADEIDMVINVGELRSGNYRAVEDDIQEVRRATHSSTILKVILETGLLSQGEKVIACELSKKAGADFVKTSTGFSSGGATVEDVQLMRRVVGLDMGVKASGGIRTWDAAVSMICAGASRLGLGSSIQIMTDKSAEGDY